MLSSKLQMGLDMYWLKQGDTSGTAGFESRRRSVLLIVAFVTLVPALCRSFTRSPRVVLGFLLTVLVQFSSSLPVALLSSVACELAPLRIVLLCVFLYLFLFFYFSFDTCIICNDYVRQKNTFGHWTTLH